MNNWKRYALACFAFGLGLASTTVNAAVFDIQSLQNQLKNNHATWAPKDNWVNQLSTEQVKRMMGYKATVRLGKDVLFDERAGTSASRAALDWRNVNGENWVSPVLNQGNCGSCVAYAAVGTLETQMNISRQQSWLNPRFSTDALFACGGGACSFGWWPDSAARFLKTTGVPDEACSPSTSAATGLDISCNSICSDSSSRSQKINNYAYMMNIQAAKDALKRGPLVTTLDVYADFIVYGSGVYKHTTGEYMGGHAVSIVGFDDANRYWIVRNSWGKDWGENGFVRVSYDDVSGIGNQTWSYDVPNVDGVVSIRNLRDRDFVSGSFSFDSISTVPNTTSLNLVVLNQTGEQSAVSCNASACAMTMDTTKMADGRYEIYLQANNGGKTISTSERKYFYVVNKEPAPMVLNMQPASGTNIQQPLTGRVVFNVDATTASVPFTSLKLLVKQGDKVVYSKGADLVLAHMTMGWRTPTVANGTYTILLEGTVDSNTTSYKAVSNQFTVTVQN